MKKKLLKSFLLAVTLLVGTSAWGVEITVCNYSFDDSTHPTVSIAGSRTHADYTHTSVISSTVFLNLWGNNDSNHDATISFGSQDLSGRDWTLEFEWAGYSGCNNKVAHTYLKAGSTNLFDIEDVSNWNTTFTIKYGSAQTATIPVAKCNSDTRISANTGNDLNTTTYWHHFKIEGSDAGVKLTITNSNSGTKILDAVSLSATNINPTSIVAKPSAGGSVAFDQLRLYYTTTYGEMYSEAKAPYDTKVASLDAAGQSYWTANVTSSASVTDEASYNTAVAALPTTYIAAVKAQTTAGSNMTDALKTAVETASWTGATGTYNGVAAERYAGDNSHFSTGNILYQTVSGLHAGYYKVKFYGVANVARNLTDKYYGSGIAQMYANSETQDVDVIYQDACSPISDTYLREFEVYLAEDNSSIEFGIKNIKEGGQWYVAQAHSLIYLGTEKNDYTINAVAGGAKIKELATGSVCASENYGTYVPYVIEKDGEFYVWDEAGTATSYKKTYTMGSTSEVKEVGYTKNSNIVAYIEGETSAGTNDSYSNGSAGAVGGGNHLNTGRSFGTHPAGVYKFTVFVTGNDFRGIAVRNNAVDNSSNLYAQVRNEGTGKKEKTFILPEERTLVVTGHYTSGTKTNQSGDFDYAILEYVEDLPSTENIVVTSAGYATYVSNYNLNFTSATTKAYKVNVAEKGVATMTKVDQVPAKTPVLLYKEGGNGEGENITISSSAMTAVEGNDLVAGPVATLASTDGDYKNMILNNVGGKIGFYFANDQTVAANRAYLHIASTLAPDASESRMVMVFADDEATAVFDLNDNSEMINNNWYDLQGRRVDGSRLNSGIYIKNGKKVVVK